MPIPLATQEIPKVPSRPLRSPGLPIFGNWFQAGNDLNHRCLADLAQAYGPIFPLRLGVRNLVVVSKPELACGVLRSTHKWWRLGLALGIGSSTLRRDEKISTMPNNEGVVIRKRLQVMLYNIMYIRMRFDEGFESMEDPKFIEAT